MNSNYDIVIIGGGLVGTSLACMLGQQSLRIAIVESVPKEKRLSQQSDLRSIALSHASQKIYATMQIWQSINEYAAIIEQLHISERGRFALSRFHASREKLSALAYVVPFQRLNQALNDCLSTATVDWLCPAQLQSISLKQDGQYELDLLMAGKPHKLQTQLLVAADGSNSAVRRLANIDRKIFDYQQNAIVATIDLMRNHKNIAYEHFIGDSAIALLPVAAQRCALIWSVPNEKAAMLMALDEAPFIQTLQKTFGYRAGRFLAISKRHSYPVKLTIAKQFYQQGLVLLGNSAYNLHPIAGQGFNLNLRDAAVLAQVICEAHAQQQALGSIALLQHYQSLREADQKRMIHVTDYLMRVFTLELWPATFLRRLGLLVVDGIPPLKHRILQQMFGLSVRAPDLACGISLDEYLS